MDRARIEPDQVLILVIVGVKPLFKLIKKKISGREINLAVADVFSFCIQY